MKGFIYIEKDNGTKYLINIRHIVCLTGVNNCKIVLDSTEKEYHVISTNIPFNEVVAMIEKAQ